MASQSNEPEDLLPRTSREKSTPEVQVPSNDEGNASSQANPLDQTLGNGSTDASARNVTVLLRKKPEMPLEAIRTESNSSETVSIQGVARNVTTLQVVKSPKKVEGNPPGAEKPSEDSDGGLFSGVGGAFNKAVEKFKKMIGYGPECLNGGTRNSAGDCMCPPFYSGIQCEQISCTNGGRPVKTKGKVAKSDLWRCECPSPDFIYGRHCELIKCMNGGRPLANAGKCECNDYWYTGTFCENYTSSWITLMAVPVVILIIAVFCCIICRIDFCPRRSTREANRHRRRYLNSSLVERRERERAGQERRLLQARNQRDMANVPYRLETIPVFNPRLLDEEPPKRVDAPPSYEQAIAMSTPAETEQQPPSYTPRHTGRSGIPPPPSCRPPAIPRNPSS